MPTYQPEKGLSSDELDSLKLAMKFIIEKNLYAKFDEWRGKGR